MVCVVTDLEKKRSFGCTTLLLLSGWFIFDHWKLLPLLLWPHLPLPALKWGMKTGITMETLYHSFLIAPTPGEYDWALLCHTNRIYILAQVILVWCRCDILIPVFGSCLVSRFFGRLLQISNRYNHIFLPIYFAPNIADCFWWSFYFHRIVINAAILLMVIVQK